MRVLGIREYFPHFLSTAFNLKKKERICGLVVYKFCENLPRNLMPLSGFADGNVCTYVRYVYYLQG